MARDRNTFAKRKREMDKKQKAAEKKIRRQKRKEPGYVAELPDSDDRPANEQAA